MRLGANAAAVLRRLSPAKGEQDWVWAGNIEGLRDGAESQRSAIDGGEAEGVHSIMRSGDRALAVWSGRYDGFG